MQQSSRTGRGRNDVRSTRRDASRGRRAIADAVSGQSLFEPLEGRRLLSAGTPYPGPAIPDATSRIEAENFDVGGEGVAYHDTDSSNDGGAYRTGDGVDIEATGDSGGGYDVGWTSAGELLTYTVNVSTAGTYFLNARVANPDAGGAFHALVDGTAIPGSISVPSTGGWQSYQTVTSSPVTLTAGQHVIKIAMDTNSSNRFIGNVNWFTFTSASQQAPTLTNADIGGATPAGSTSVSSGTYTVTGGGFGLDSLGNGDDQFHLSYTAVTGDFTAITQVTSSTPPNGFSNLGLMARDGLSNSPR